MDSLQNALLHQMEDTWRIVDQAIDLINTETWLVREHQFSYGQRLFHLLETWEFYIRDSPEGMSWGHLIDLPSNLTKENWESELYHSLEKNLTPDKLSGYFNLIREESRRKINQASTDDLMSPDGFEKHIPSRIAKYIYLIRHTMWHLGELAQYQRQTQSNPMKWDT